MITAAAVGLAGGVVWAAVSPGQEVAQVKLEAHSTAGDNPFMPPVGQDQPTVTPPAGAAGSFSGDTPGLYAGSDEKPSCSSQSLISNLQGDGTRAGAWAQALNIRTEEIPNYARSLNPVVLRADTAVTEHGYSAPAYNSYPAVLQAGTAVFVNSFGEPTVKCFSGNPLTRPGDYAQVDYTGTRWGYFQPGKYTYVRPTRVIINVYKYYDNDSHGVHEHHNFCADHRGESGCRIPNPDRHCDDGNQPGCKAKSDETKHTPDPKLEANAKKANDDAATTDDAAKKAAATAQGLEQQATSLRAAAQNLPEPARSAQLAQADQLDQAAKQARTDADTKAAGAKKAAEAAAQAQADADKAAGRDPKLEAGARKATADSEAADLAAKNAAATAQNLQNQAASLKTQGDASPEPARSALLAQAAQVEQAAKQAKADAETKAADAQKAAEAAKQAKTDADKATGDAKTGDTKTGDTKTGDTKTGDTKTGDTKTGDTTTDGTQTQTGEKTGEKPGQTGEKTGQTGEKTGQTGGTGDAGTGGEPAGGTGTAPATGGTGTGPATGGTAAAGGNSPFTPPGTGQQPQVNPCIANPLLPQCKPATGGATGGTTTGGAKDGATTGKDKKDEGKNDGKKDEGKKDDGKKDNGDG